MPVAASVGPALENVMERANRDPAFRGELERALMPVALKSPEGCGCNAGSVGGTDAPKVRVLTAAEVAKSELAGEGFGMAICVDDTYGRESAVLGRLSGRKVAIVVKLDDAHFRDEYPDKRRMVRVIVNEVPEARV